MNSPKSFSAPTWHPSEYWNVVLCTRNETIISKYDATNYIVNKSINPSKNDFAYANTRNSNIGIKYSILNIS